MLVKKDEFNIEEPFDHLALEPISIFAIAVSEGRSFQRGNNSPIGSQQLKMLQGVKEAEQGLKTYSVKAQLIAVGHFCPRRVCGSHSQSYNTLRISLAWCGNIK